MQINKLDNFIENYPKESLKILTMALFFIWQSMPSIVGLFCYLFFRRFKIKYFVSFVSGVVLCLGAIWFLKLNLISYFHFGFNQNINFWKTIFSGSKFHYKLLIYFSGIPFLITALLDGIDLIQENPHKKVMKDLHNGWESAPKELCGKKITACLNQLSDTNFNGVLLGVSKYSGKPLVIPDEESIKWLWF